MSDELQQITWDETRALVEANLAPREPGLNTGASETSGSEDGPELIIPNDAGTTFYRYPSLTRLAYTSAGNSGSELIGLDNTGLNVVTATNVYNAIVELDTALDSASTPENPTLSDIASNSASTADQTFVIDNSTNLKLGNVADDTYLEIQSGGAVDLYGAGTLSVHPSDFDIEATGSGVCNVTGGGDTNFQSTSGHVTLSTSTASKDITLDSTRYNHLKGTNTLISNTALITPDSLVHVYAGSAGAVSAPAGTVQTIENSGDNLLSFLFPATNEGGMNWNNGNASIILDEVNKVLNIETLNAGYDIYIEGYERVDIVSSTGPISIMSNGATITAHETDPVLKIEDVLELNPTASDPSTLRNGMIWYNSTSHTFKGRANGATVTFTVS